MATADVAPALRSHAPANWYGRKAWGRLLAKVHDLDVMACPRCGSRMAVLAVIVDPAQIRKIIACLEHHGRGPPLLG